MKKNSSIRLKELMQHFGISQTDLIRKTGIPKSAMSMYLNGKRVPRQNRLSDIAEAYGVSETWLMGYDVPMKNEENIVKLPSTQEILSKDDKKLLSVFHSLDQQGQDTVQYILRNEKTRCEKIRSQESKIKELENELIPKRIFAYYGKIAAAGKPVEFSDIMAGTIEVPDSGENINADFTIGVSGDSMEPTYYDGDIVYVKKSTHLNVGDIGIFSKESEIYIKEVGETGLISHNKKYDPITLVEYANIECIGKVVGKV